MPHIDASSFWSKMKVVTCNFSHVQAGASRPQGKYLGRHDTKGWHFLKIVFLTRIYIYVLESCRVKQGHYLFCLVKYYTVHMHPRDATGQNS